jgi:hypothetical protein
MSLTQYTLADARRRVDYHLRDRDGASESFSLFEKNVAIESHMRLLAPRLLLGDQWSTSLCTLVAGTDTYTLPTATAQQYDRLKKLRLRSNGLEIPVVSLESFEAYREADIAPGSGTPQVAMVIEGANHTPTLRVWPTPNAADYVEGFFSLLPAALGHTDSNVIPFDDEAFEALCYEVAAELYGKMTEDERAKRKLGPETPALWGGLAASGIKASRHRRRRQQGGQTVLRRRAW